MAIPQEEWRIINYKKALTQVLGHYLLFCLLFLFIHIILASLVAFFNFLLGHDMGSIESWLNNNGWDLLSFAKVGAFALIIKSIRLTSNTPSSRALIKQSFALPSKELLIMVMYLIFFSHFSLHTFSQNLTWNDNYQFERVLTSYLGTTLFYLIDVFFVFYILAIKKIKITKASPAFVLAFSCTLLFTIVFNIVLPYSTMNQSYLVLFIISLFYVLMLSHHQLTDVLLLQLFVISFVTILYGHDILWDTSSQLLIYESDKSTGATIILWIGGLIFYTQKRLHNLTKVNAV